MTSAFVVVFSKTYRFFVLNKCTLWLQSRSCFTANFCYLTLSSVYLNQGLNFAKIFHALVTLCFVAPEQKLFYGNFGYLTLSSLC